MDVKSIAYIIGGAVAVWAFSGAATVLLFRAEKGFLTLKDVLDAMTGGAALGFIAVGVALWDWVSENAEYVTIWRKRPEDPTPPASHTRPGRAGSPGR